MRKAGLFSVLVIIGIIFLFSPLLAQSQTVYLTSLDWPPYTGASLQDMGASSVVAVAAFKAMGYDLKIEIYAWERAVNLAKVDPKYAGYFPEYYSADNAKDFLYSDPMGSGPLGFVERKDNSIAWNTLDDLKKYVIGVVSGYINTDAFDKMVADKLLKVEAVDDDATNIKKVALKRIPLAVIDKNVLSYLLSTDKTLVQYKNDLQFNARPLELKKLYICFKNDATGAKLAKIFNDGLKKINVDKIMQDYFAKALSK